MVGPSPKHGVDVGSAICALNLGYVLLAGKLLLSMPGSSPVLSKPAIYV